MKKITKISLLLIILCFSLSVLKVKADSGFDSSYDSGSSYSSGGYSSSYDYGSSYDYSSSSYDNDFDSDDAGFVIIVFTIIIIFWIVLAIIVVPSSKKKNNSYDIYKGMSKDDVKKVLGESFDVDEFLRSAFKIYYDIQIAWMNRDIDSVRNILGDEIYNSYKMQLLPLIASDQVNVMEDIKLKNTEISTINIDNDKQIVNVFMEVTCHDYIIDNKTKKVLRGSKKKVNYYLYKLSFERTISKDILTKCPKCGAPLGEGHSVKCEYCAAVITRPTDKFVLIDKKMLRQK